MSGGFPGSSYVIVSTTLPVSIFTPKIWQKVLSGICPLRELGRRGVGKTEFLIRFAASFRANILPPRYGFHRATTLH